jgi:hypothetical protein
MKPIKHQKNHRANKPSENDWLFALSQCGDVLRPGARDGKTARMLVLARSYQPPLAARRLAMPVKVVERAVSHHILLSFPDPATKKPRIPASLIENAYQNEEAWEEIAGWHEVLPRQISLVGGFAYTTARNRMRKAGIKSNRPFWNQVRGQWGLPSSYKEFIKIWEEKLPAWLETKSNREASQWEKAGDDFVERPRFHQRDAPQRLPASQRNEIRQRLASTFPSWNMQRSDCKVHLHIGPTNSGKTYDALTDLISAGSGWYLAPLRLLAFEVYDTLNSRGVLCNLLTGEERIEVPGATITAATIEMYDPRIHPECIVIDEAQMLSDPQRGWAWTRALMETPSSNIHVLGAPSSEQLVTRMASEVGMEIIGYAHERLAPLEVSSKPFHLAHLPPRTILIAFSRFMVLALKSELEHVHHRSCSVIYGNLPPEVRRSQSTRFMQGETDIAVATDAVGMGLNLPADLVCFYEVDKFDGKERRPLTANEVQQIGGRAGRFGLSTQSGLVGALTVPDAKFLKQAFQEPIEPLEFARVSPSPEALELIPGHLAMRLSLWQQLQTIPDQWREFIMPMDLSDPIELAGMLTMEEIEQLGLPVALRLINAPTQRETRSYWRNCASSIIHAEPMPLPDPVHKIETSKDLGQAEASIRSADIYLWLACRSEFTSAGPDYEQVHSLRRDWWQKVDQALQKKIDTSRRCRNCGRKIPLTHRYAICDSCYRSRRQDDYNNEYY